MEHPQLQASIQTRDAFWSSIGQLNSDVFVPLINPAFAGNPAWPALRQSFGKIDLSDGSVILFSDGLSDPFEGQEGLEINGFELEFYIHTDTLPEAINQSWQLDLLNQVAQLAVENGSIHSLLNKHRYLSVELYPKFIPSQFLNSDGRVGVMLGIASKVIPETIKLPLSEAKTVSVVLLTLKELEYLVDKGDEERALLAEKIMNATGTLTTLNRVSVI